MLNDTMIKISQTENMGNSKAHMRLTYTNKQYTEGEEKRKGEHSHGLKEISELLTTKCNTQTFSGS